MQEHTEFKKIFLITLVVSLTISALVGIIIFLIGDFGETEARILLTTLSIGGFSLTGLCCASLYERGRVQLLATLGMITSVIGFLFSLLLIWEAIEAFDEGSWKIMLILIILSASIAHACLMLLINSKNHGVNYALSATLIFIGIVAIMIIIPILTEFDDLGEFYYRLLGVFAILDALGTIATPILNKIHNN